MNYTFLYEVPDKTRKLILKHLDINYQWRLHH